MIRLVNSGFCLCGRKAVCEVKCYDIVFNPWDLRCKECLPESELRELKAIAAIRLRDAKG